ncbi:class I SAM-dependent methyltransferase [Bosea caraganae]|uniref:Class I SAM-dependent methyltransferase n=2 Tax=Bosea caraganae TaxID=2763117 RepID=A0A370L6Y1_9HYPH|nr:class I SAM-dependent methyltransferase [Bosea caraganae]RDJ25822.1 class I SAM-dependent methyltransferase [Bosea caraganae]
MHVTPPDQSHVSQNIARFDVPEQYRPDALVINLGSGNVPAPDPRALSIDVLPNSNVDLVAEAEHLPLVGGSADLICSGAVFEHVYDPMAAVAEVRRVLKEGGEFYIDTAFLQGYHGYPSHFFNMTIQAAETHLVDDFILLESTIPTPGSPLEAVSTITRRFLEAIPAADAKRLRAMSLSDALDEIERDRSGPNKLFKAMSPFDQRALAASVLVRGKKPASYSALRGELSSHIRREYYATRQTVYLRHHQALLYRNLAIELGSKHEDVAPPALNDIFEAAAVANPMLSGAFESGIKSLNESERELMALRDRWVGEYLRMRDKPSSS